MQKRQQGLAWVEIKRIVETALKRFPTSLKDDIVLLEKDKTEHFLSVNKRNSLKYTKNEKIMLHFLKKCAEKVDEILLLNQEDALKKVASLEGLDMSRDYFKHLCTLLEKGPEYDEAELELLTSMKWVKEL